ncbi:MAG: AraC family transcriptional regulator [Chloroflexota bacterium]
MAFAERDVHVMVVMISPAFIEEMSSFLGIPAVFQDLLDTLPLLKGDVLSETLEQLAKSIDDVATREELFMDVIGSMLQILRLRHRAVAQLAGRKAQTIDDLLICMLRARQFLDARYLEDIKTQHVAAHVGLSEYHFARLFKTAFGITVHQYVIQLRLRAARNLLEASDKSITEIALTMSYQSLSAFINAFRRYVGVSPSVYRSKLSRLSK